MKTNLTSRSSTLLFGLALAVIGFAPHAAWAADAIQSQTTNVSGIVADLIECKRAEGVLTIKLRMRNTGSDSVFLIPVPERADSYYVTAESKKYFVLRDSERTPLMSSEASPGVGTRIAKAASWTFWARFPAPPGNVKKISYYTALTPPFDNVPITDE